MGEELATRVPAQNVDTEKICYWKDADGLWWLYLPQVGAGVLSRHIVTEHEDGTITVTPSIVMTGHQNNTRHGYLTRGVWKE